MEAPCIAFTIITSYPTGKYTVLRPVYRKVHPTLLFLQSSCLDSNEYVYFFNGNVRLRKFWLWLFLFLCSLVLAWHMTREDKWHYTSFCLSAYRAIQTYTVAREQLVMGNCPVKVRSSMPTLENPTEPAMSGNTKRPASFVNLIWNHQPASVNADCNY